MAVVIKTISPPSSLKHAVDGFWMLQNSSDETKEVVIVPDGRIDLSLSKSGKDPFHITLMGLGSAYEQIKIFPRTTIFAISFHPIASEFILEEPVASIVNSAMRLPDNFWGFTKKDLGDFDNFCSKAIEKITECLSAKKMDERKLKLFDLIFASKGAAAVQELSKQVHWGSRQINRYFNQQYGLSLKVYCNIIRFRSSFSQLKQGKLFPEEHFADQSHFIKEIKRLSGVSPKKLAKNQNDRFVQFLAVKPK